MIHCMYMYDTFLLHVQQNYDNHFPYKKLNATITGLSPLDYLMGSITLSDIKTICKTFLRHPTANNKSIYILYKNKLNFLIKTACLYPLILRHKNKQGGDVYDLFNICLTFFFFFFFWGGGVLTHNTQS